MYGKIPYLCTPPDPDSARIRILFYNYFFLLYKLFFCSIISGTGMIYIAYLYTAHNYKTVCAKFIIERNK